MIHAGGVGVRELGKPALVDANTQFMAASNTKGMTTLLLAKLADEGKLRWYQPVTELYPSFKLGTDAITSQVLVKHLVCVCTGLPRQDMEWIFEYKNDTALTSMKMLATNSPTSGFGELYQYNNLMAAAAGYVGGAVAYPTLTMEVRCCARCSGVCSKSSTTGRLKRRTTSKLQLAGLRWHAPRWSS